MPYLKEEEWGLSDYFPINGKLTLSENDKNLHVDLPPIINTGKEEAQNTIL